MCQLACVCTTCTRWLWRVEEGIGSQGRNQTYSFVSHLVELLNPGLYSPLYWSFLYNDKFQSILRIWSGVYLTCEAGSYYFTCVKISILLNVAPNKQLILVYIWNLFRSGWSLLRIKTGAKILLNLSGGLEGPIVPAHWNAKNKWVDYRFVHN